MMYNYIDRYWWDYTYVHTYPGQTANRHTNKHNAARKARFTAKHNKS